MSKEKCYARSQMFSRDEDISSLDHSSLLFFISRIQDINYEINFNFDAIT